jgi:endonuclease/exonuclease/phosphatase family metal-dependent hydrolase
MTTLKLPLPVLVVALLSAHALAGEPRDVTATVGAWNIKAKPDPIDSIRAKEIARGIVYLDAEVLALVEVRPPEIVAEIVAELARLGAEYRYALPPQLSELQLALLYKPGVEVAGVRCLDEINLQDPELRKALVADVRIGRFDFHLVAVHLKSGGDTAERGIRARQAEILARHIRQATVGEEKDVVLVGDYNLTPTRDAETFPILSADGRLRFISNEDLSNLGSHIFRGRYGNLLDGFAVSGRQTREYIEGTLRIFPMNRAFRLSLSDYERRVSDHLPVVGRFQIVEDDD